jgi:hypothetical protein
MRNKYLYITLLAILGITPEMMAQEKIQHAPRLVVNITIDQLRADYLEAFSPLYGTDGFRKLLQQGLVFYNSVYPFSPIDRASATASLATGTSPYYHSIVSGQWLDRETLRPVYCTGKEQKPDELSTSTIGDELKMATEGKSKVFSIAPFDDAAIFSAGHAANAAFWIDDRTGLWCSSPYYIQQLPAWLQSFNQLYSPARDNSKQSWEPAFELSGKFNYFQHTENSQRPFKHRFSGAERFTQLKTSGMVNACVTEMAQRCVSQETMGIDRVTDYLAVCYYAGTFEHKPVSECQIELQDTYVRLDFELAKLMRELTKTIGAENVLFVVSSTGYSDAEGSDYSKYRIPTGTFSMTRAANLLNVYMGAVWGSGRYVESCFQNQMFLNQKLLESKRVSLTDACQRAQEFLTQLSGVRNVYSSLQLLTSTSEHIQKVRNGYNPARCGDILIEVSPGWTLYNEDNHDTQLSRASFIQFPIIFYGAGTKAERVTDHVTIDRIAPSIAKAIRIRAPNACSAEPLF